VALPISFSVAASALSGPAKSNFLLTQPLGTKAPSWSISRRLIFVASLGLRLLLNGARAVEKNGGKLVLFRPNENVQSVLRLAGIEKLIPIIFDRPAAVEEVLRANPITCQR
jgi:hypothetical protein